VLSLILVDAKAKPWHDGKSETASSAVLREAQITKNNGNDHHDANDVKDVHPDSPQKMDATLPLRQTCRSL
jgi:hypothetical protein